VLAIIFDRTLIGWITIQCLFFLLSNPLNSLFYAYFSFSFFLLALKPDFDDVDKSNPNCVVIGDAQDDFSYANMNAAFQMLTSLDKPVLISMGQG
jgi:hypothetical protein